MGTMDATSGSRQRQQTSGTSSRLRVFINYRHDDTWGQAMLLHERLSGSFGSENVFLDVQDLQPGMKWLDEIKSRRASCNVLLSLIGPHWVSIMKSREQEAVAQPAEDYVRFEIEYALKPNSGIWVIPVLVGDVMPPSAGDLPRPLRALAKIQAVQVRKTRFEDDVADLIGKIEAISRQEPAPASDPLAPRRADLRPPAPISATANGVAAPPPDAVHWEFVVEQVADEGALVPYLGSQLTGNHAASGEDLGSLPGAEQLAADLAKRFGVPSARLELPEVAQYVYVMRGWPALYRGLKEILNTEYEPGPVHRFLARLPQTLDGLGLEKRYQLIVTTNFDRALEQAFDDAQEPYDLALYMAKGPDGGRFVHFPYEGSRVSIDIPNRYGKFPIRVDGELERTVIVKIHGAADGDISDYRIKENYVITEDQYIDYLSSSPIETLVPVQILEKLRDSHCLFLGYTVRDWNLRVFLKRIWDGGRIGARSWAVEPEPDALEREFWKQSGVDLYTADLADYVGQLHERLARRAPESAGP
jgi:hypothetical protein